MIRLIAAMLLTHWPIQVKPYDTPPPLDQRDIRPAGYTGGSVIILTGPYPGDTAEGIPQVQHGEYR